MLLYLIEQVAAVRLFWILWWQQESSAAEAQLLPERRSPQPPSAKLQEIRARALARRRERQQKKVQARAQPGSLQAAAPRSTSQCMINRQTGKGSMVNRVSCHVSWPRRLQQRLCRASRAGGCDALPDSCWLTMADTDGFSGTTILKAVVVTSGRPSKMSLAAQSWLRCFTAPGPSAACKTCQKAQVSCNSWVPYRVRRPCCAPFCSSEFFFSRPDNAGRPQRQDATVAQTRCFGLERHLWRIVFQFYMRLSCCFVCRWEETSTLGLYLQFPVLCVKVNYMARPCGDARDGWWGGSVDCPSHLYRDHLQRVD